MLVLFGGTLIGGGWGVVEWSRKSYLGAAEITSFYSMDLIQSNEHDTFWHIVSTGYCNALILWAISVSDFLPLEIYNNLGPPLSSITFTVNSHADNHFYKYIYLFQTLYDMKSAFLLKYKLRFFIFKFDLNVKHWPYFFL